MGGILWEKKFVKKIKYIQKEKISEYKVDNSKAQKGIKFKGRIDYKMHNQNIISELAEINAQYKNVIDYIKKLNATQFIGKFLKGYFINNQKSLIITHLTKKIQMNENFIYNLIESIF